jgi:beta-mannosidase
MQRVDLSLNWQFQQHHPGENPLEAATEGWNPAQVPGTVHQDLMQAGKISDPFFGLNENDVQWVGEADWLYRCTFNVAEQLLVSEHIDLCFDGLDTYATVWLNGEQILVCDNMFIPGRVPIKRLLKLSDNVLLILFESAMRHGKALEAQNGKRPAWNGDTSRLYVRKAQYHYGWDWGPILMTAGLWRPVYLQAYSARMLDISTNTSVSTDLKQAVVDVQITLEPASGYTVKLELYAPTGELVKSVVLPASEKGIGSQITVENPALWYPNGYGEHPLYRLVVTLHNGETTLDSREMQIGLRRLRLVQEPLDSEPGTTFLFEINNIPVFCGGANWIPADSFTPRISAETYRAWVKLAADANMTMLRVWGGGIYEDDKFYELCDELGLLVWQDFMFACGMYPAYPWFLDSVRAEAEAAIRRLRHHACIALWCGNNEDYQIAEGLNVYDSTVSWEAQSQEFPGRTIYEHVLPEVCARLDPTRTYWPGSPYGGRSVADQTVGDRHTWEIWHGPKADYRDYPKYEGRFVSEFGMQALPDLPTVETFTTATDRSPASAVLNHHNKASDGPERLNHYIAANVQMPDDLPAYIYASQFIQSESVAAAYDGWRRRWAGPGHYAVAGALVWQINDCWPVTSWALVDYYLKPKPAYYRTRRCLAPIALGVAPADQGTAVWAVNSTLEVLTANLEVHGWDFEGNHLGVERQSVALRPNAAAELGVFGSAFSSESPVVVAVKLVQNDVVLARAVRWPEPPKNHTYPDPGLSITPEGDNQLRVSVERPARGVYLTAPGTVMWSDNMLDLIPGDPQITRATGLGSTAEIRVQHLGTSQKG